jgi:hypothetical protein
MALLWFSASLVYYGISLAGSVLSEGMPLWESAALSALCEVPAALLSSYLLEHHFFGRRRSTFTLYLVGGVCCASLSLFPEAAAPIIAILGKFFITTAFDGIYVYASEVFEVRVRGAALGLCSSCARLGSIAAPQAVALLSTNRIMQLFGGSALVAAVACATCLPETRPGGTVDGGGRAYERLEGDDRYLVEDTNL